MIGWSFNLQATVAIRRHALDHADRRELLEMCGLVTPGSRVMVPDDTRIYEMRHPTSSRPDTGDRLIYQRDKHSQAPPGLAVLPPVEVAEKAARKERERKPPKRRQVRKVVQAPRVDAPCGTTAGYEQHRNRGEDTCQPCREARNAYAREWARKRGGMKANCGVCGIEHRRDKMLRHMRRRHPEAVA